MAQEVIEITEREIEIIEIVDRGPAGPAGPQANINYTVVNSAQVLSNSQNIAADTSGGSFTLTLPANPNEGDSIDIFDYSETFDTNPLTIARNGKPIEGLAEDLVCNVEGAYFTLIYTGSIRGWQVLPRFGTSGGGGGETVLTTQGDMLYRGFEINTRLPIGTSGQILKVNSGATAPEWGAAPDSIDDYTVATSNQAIVNGARIAADTSSGSFTLTLPAAPQQGDTVYILDLKDTFDTNNLIIARNGNNIEGQSDNLTCDVEGSSFKLVFSGSPTGWQFIPYYGVAGVSSVGISGSDGIEVDSGSPVTGSGTIALGVNAATLRSHINVANGANNYTHPNHSGDVTSAGDGATTIANDAVTNAKLANVATSTIKGRATAGTGDPEDLSASQVRTILNVADGAEVNVNADWNATTGDAAILNKPATFTPSAHASTHHTGGTDAIAPNNIGAAWALVLSGQTITGNTLLAAGRNRRITLFAVGVTANVDLPHESNQNGDVVTLVSSWSVASTLTIRRASVMGGSTPVAYLTLATLNASGQPFTFVSDGTATGWSLRAVDTHTHGSITNDGKLGTTSGLPLVTTTAGAITTLALGSANQVLRVNGGATGVEFGAGFDAASPPAIGSTTPAAGTFTTLAANSGTLTASAPVLDLAQTWNNSGTVFSAIRLNVTDTASVGTSLLLNLQVGASTVFSINRAGQCPNDFQANSLRTSDTVASGSAYKTINSGSYEWSSNNSRFGTSDVFLRRDAAGVLAQYNAANPQEYRIYNTFTSATNHERGFLRWSSNVFQIGTEKGSGGGSAREIQFQTDGVTRVTIGSGVGNISATNAVFAGTTAGLMNNLGVVVASGNFVGWTDGSTNSGTRDVTLHRDGAGDKLALRRSTNAQEFRIYNTVGGTGNVDFDRVNFRWASNEFIIDAEAGGTGTLRGIKIGSATSSLLGFYGVTPVDQPATVADPAGGGTIDAEARTAINTIIDRLQELGLVA